MASFPCGNFPIQWSLAMTTLISLRIQNSDARTVSNTYNVSILFYFFLNLLDPICTFGTFYSSFGYCWFGLVPLLFSLVLSSYI